MKNALFTIFRILIGLVLVGKILNWFLDFSYETNQILNMVMFCLIGIAYIVMGYVWDNKFKKIVITTCGLSLIAMNFLDSSTTLYVIGIVCILTPMFIARFYKEQDGKENVPES